ncbi:TOBE domain-containing protein [Nocardioides terrisoli]|uniref:TOBE domain-containing protein n=1 Tax=Nocardioides terrisoli TaxID=3388267 RepID=UPI00287BA1CA|nr:TOBE domain-containing protein [Nocardioides marmorisolisilvae]
MPTYRIRDAAELLGVSDDTVRRWADAGRLDTATDDAGRHVVDGASLAAFAQAQAEPGHAAEAGPGATVSARNRLVGLVTKVTRDTVMAQVELQCGPYRVVSLMSREAADELGLEPGVLATAVIKSTNVVVETPAT